MFDEISSDLYRKGGSSENPAISRAEKLTKVLNKLRNDTLGTCKKTKSLPALVQR